ncbi:ligand-binding/transglycosylase domain-containing protein [Alcanivorax hongdengensis A-11-3]|uniref:Ligand-binding/transglycosylase domain-containing protein n=1 Tax=Alcanivorax hongdengensis A-11-3 TaxID=1177179 RepID=L0W7T1_9GAMM|nr:ligand-binding/transglycosylase domain-containing protein [Alcanivorax hongdengensis A-11-3]
MLLLTALLASGCDSSGSGGFFTTFQNYQEIGDLPALREHGIVRLLAPRFDEESGLTRNGIPTTEYQRLAEQFAGSLGLEARWVYASDYAQLQDLLLDGKGDIIVTNYSMTDARRDKMGFSAPVNTIEERLVVAPSLAGKSLSEMGALTLSVPAGTAYLETARKLVRRHDNLTLEVLHDSISDEELVEAVASGELAATIVDGNMLDAMLMNRDDVAAGPVVNRKRRIAWAVRPDSKELLEQINQFIIREQVHASQPKAALRDWKAIKQSGVLRVITSNNPASYFIWRGELMGFDYDLIKDFAKQQGLRLSMVVRDSPSAMFAALSAGDGDVIAASMTDTPERRKRGWNFTDRYLEINEQLIGSADKEPITDPAWLAGRAVVVNPETAYMDTLNELQDNDDIDVDIEPREGASTESLIDAVADGEFELTLADSHLAAMESTYRDDIKVLYTFPQTKNIAWGLRADQTELKKRLNAYIHRQYRGLFYNVTYNRYFKEKKTIAAHESYRVAPGKAISPFDDMVKREALKYGLDWRLVTAQMYQESRFNPNAHSFAGAQGLLQVMPRTAREFGYSNLKKPEQGIAAGLAYFNWLEERFPPRIDLADKLYFTLAAYNAGHGHVEDARRLAQKLGKDPDRWFGEVEQAMLLLSKPQYARQARYGYVRGSEPVQYVRKIKNRYLAYVSALDGAPGITE